MSVLLTYTISLYLKCINSVNQILPMRGKGISIALGSLSGIPIAFAIRSFDLSARLRNFYRAPCSVA